VFAKRTGPGITKLADRSTPGVFLGYEPGTKGYRVYDPVNNKLLVTRDVLFDEKSQWNWGVKTSETGDRDRAALLTPDFIVELELADDFQAVVGAADSEDAEPVVAVPEPVSPGTAIPSGGGAFEGSPHTPSSTTGPTHQIQWATPPTDASVGTDEAPRR